MEAVSGAPVRVLVYATAPAGDPDAVAAAYHQISTGLRGVPGLLGNELLRSVHDPAAYAVASYWADLDAFRGWEVTPGHPLSTAPLRPYQTPGRSAGIYQVAAAYPIRSAAVPSAQSA
jgi:heme-degrading monooxygenase HmoA